MSGIICSECGRDIDALGQDNMSFTSEPLCEDCWSEVQRFIHKQPKDNEVKADEDQEPDQGD